MRPFETQSDVSDQMDSVGAAVAAALCVSSAASQGPQNSVSRVLHSGVPDVRSFMIYLSTQPLNGSEINFGLQWEQNIYIYMYIYI